MSARVNQTPNVFKFMSRPSRHVEYASGVLIAVSSEMSLSTKKKTTGTNSSALYAATHSELNIDTPEKPDRKPKPICTGSTHR